MIRYYDLVRYIKNNHVDWNTDLFDVLRGFFEEYSRHDCQSPSTLPAQQKIDDFLDTGFTEPKEGEYTIQDIINLFST